jgi:hypothetical protein
MNCPRDREADLSSGVPEKQQPTMKTRTGCVAMALNELSSNWVHAGWGR